MTDNQADHPLDAVLKRVLVETIPDDVCRRLERRFEDFRNQVPAGSPACVQSSVSHGCPDRRRLIPLGTTVACAVLLALGVAAWHVAFPLDAWAQVVRAAQSKPWIHLAQEPAGDAPAGESRIEFWFCPRQGITAMTAAKAGDVQFAAFTNSVRKTSLQYRASEGILHAGPYKRAEGEIGQFDLFVSAFARGEQTVKFDELDNVRLVKQDHRRVDANGESWVVYELTFEEQHGQKEQYIAEFRVDPDTLLPRFWSRRSPDGRKQIRFSIDYPEAGPQDVYALGVPRTSELRESHALADDSAGKKKSPADKPKDGIDVEPAATRDRGSEGNETKSPAAVQLERKGARVAYFDTHDVYSVFRARKEPVDGCIDNDDLRRLTEQEPRIRELNLSDLAAGSEQRKSSITNESLEIIGRMRDLWSLAIDYADVADDGLRPLEGLNLRHLDLSHTRVTDSGVAWLVQTFPNLSSLALDGTNITDKSLVHIGNLAGLMAVRLHQTKVSKTGLLQLKDLPKLIDVGAVGTQVSAEDQRELQQAMPKVQFSVIPRK